MVVNEKISQQVGIEPRTAISVGQCLIHGAPTFKEIFAQATCSPMSTILKQKLLIFC